MTADYITTRRPIYIPQLVQELAAAGITCDSITLTDQLYIAGASANPMSIVIAHSPHPPAVQQVDEQKLAADVAQLKAKAGVA